MIYCVEQRGCKMRNRDICACQLWDTFRGPRAEHEQAELFIFFSSQEIVRVLERHGRTGDSIGDMT